MSTWKSIYSDKLISLRIFRILLYIKAAIHIIPYVTSILAQVKNFFFLFKKCCPMQLSVDHTVQRLNPPLVAQKKDKMFIKINASKTIFFFSPLLPNARCRPHTLHVILVGVHPSSSNQSNEQFICETKVYVIHIKYV